MTAAPRRVLARSSTADAERGSAVVEFAVLVPVLLLPLVYLLLAVFAIQDASYGVTAAAREAGRAFVTTPPGDDPYARAAAAAGIALGDHRLALGSGGLTVTCTPEACLPGAVAQVRLATTVTLPLVPRSILGRHPAAITVTAAHREVVDRFHLAAGSRTGAAR